MKLSMREVMYAVVIGAFAMGVQAQTPSTATQPQADTPKMTGAATADAKAKADADYKAALEACNAKTGAEKESCQKDAKAAHEHAMGKKDTSMTGAPQGSMGAGQSSTGGYSSGSGQK
jgi:hyperosmotically inducible periplasmic protein